MTEGGFFTVHDFALFTRTTRDTLHHYDKLGLLSPALRGENHYRYYSSRQLGTVNLIRTLQDLGMSLTEIKNLRDNRNPENIEQALASQIEEVEKILTKWSNAHHLLTTLRKNIRSVANIDKDAITVQELPREAIIMGKENDYSDNKGPYDALIDFYYDMQERYPDLDLNYPVWGFFSKDRIRSRDWMFPDHYYFCNPKGWDERPAGIYATGYSSGDYGQNGELYKRMLAYIEGEGLEVAGDVYEEYPINEISAADPSLYLSRLLIPVSKKG